MGLKDVSATPKPIPSPSQSQGGFTPKKPDREGSYEGVLVEFSSRCDYLGDFTVHLAIRGEGEELLRAQVKVGKSRKLEELLSDTLEAHGYGGDEIGYNMEAVGLRVRVEGTIKERRWKDNLGKWHSADELHTSTHPQLDVPDNKFGM
jgi:hypothetical protein